MRVALTGPHGTGKSTLLQALQQVLQPCLSVVVCREAPRLIIERAGDPEFFRRGRNTLARQNLIFVEHLLEERKSAERPHDLLLTDRTLVDHLAYTLVLFPEVEITPETNVYKQLAFESLSYYDEIIRLPIEFPPIDDGVREADTTFQNDIERQLLKLFNEAGVTPHVVSGSIEERVVSIRRRMKV